jgi:hypothetical protein
MTVHTVDRVTGMPTDAVLAEATILADTVPAGSPGWVTATFGEGAPTLAACERFALVLHMEFGSYGWPTLLATPDDGYPGGTAWRHMAEMPPTAPREPEPADTTFRTYVTTAGTTSPPVVCSTPTATMSPTTTSVTPTLPPTSTAPATSTSTAAQTATETLTSAPTHSATRTPTHSPTQTASPTSPNTSTPTSTLTSTLTSAHKYSHKYALSHTEADPV